MENKIRTIEVRSTKDTIVKAGELVDVVEVTPLTVTDRKIYNLLIDNAKQDIAKPIEHVIPKERLRITRRGYERVDESVERLMGAIAKIKTVRNGEPAIIRVQLLGKNVEHISDDGNFYYSFDPVLREVFSNSTVFARLKMDVMLNFQGKYGLALYEMVEKRINLRKSSEIFDLDNFRCLLGIAPEKLRKWSNLKTKAIEPAVAEVNQLAVDFRVEVNGVKTGNKFTDIELKWWRTAPDGEESALQELAMSKLGRKARREGKVEELLQHPDKLEFLLSENAMEQARNILIKGNKRMGLQAALQQWEEAFKDKVRPENPNGAFIAFCKKIA